MSAARFDGPARSPAEPLAGGIRSDETGGPARSPAAARRAVHPEPGVASTARAPLALVLVHGRVHAAGAPVTDYDVSFRALGADERDEEIDWDFTDDRGRYSVRLPAARYLVANDDDQLLAELTVPRDADEVLLDLHLPSGNR